MQCSSNHDPTVGITKGSLSLPMSLMAFRIIFRAFQGLGGGSCYSMGTVIISELVPQSKYAAYTARLSVAVSLALLVGPIIGGVISENTTWRWIFIIK